MIRLAEAASRGISKAVSPDGGVGKIRGAGISQDFLSPSCSGRLDEVLRNIGNGFMAVGTA